MAIIMRLNFDALALLPSLNFSRSILVHLTIWVRKKVRVLTSVSTRIYAHKCAYLLKCLRRTYSHKIRHFST